MKLFISFLIALAIFILCALIINILEKLIKKYGDDAVSCVVTICCIIALLTFIVYSFLM